MCDWTLVALWCGRTGSGRAVYGHVITKYPGMGRFTYPCNLRGRRKKGRGEGEKHERGEREGSACYKSRCFCNPPTIFWTNPIMPLSIRDQSQLRGFSAWFELNYFVYWELSSWDAFFKWYHKRAKWNIFTVLAPAANTTNRLRTVSHFLTARSLRQTMISLVWINKTFYLTTSSSTMVVTKNS